MFQPLTVNVFVFFCKKIIKRLSLKHSPLKKTLYFGYKIHKIIFVYHFKFVIGVCVGKGFR